MLEVSFDVYIYVCLLISNYVFDLLIIIIMIKLINVIKGLKKVINKKKIF